MRGKVVLVAPRQDWADAYRREADVLTGLLGGNLVELHHVGSTSIPGIMAKPIIDILPVVRSLADVDLIEHEFASRGYLYRGEHGLAERRYVVGLAEDGHEHRVHIHMFREAHGEIARLLSFRDFLRSQPVVAREYERVKVRLQALFASDRQRYQDGKSEFCETTLRRAMGSSYRPPAS
jgi:GrpB-like predicted nucleotidyltransferase (UPF0157 family)